MIAPKDYRRAGLRLAQIVAIFLCLGGSSTSAQAPNPKPSHINFLFVYTDDQRWDALGFYQKILGDKGRFPWLKTPNLDRLAAQGVWFRNSFATDSLCSPSRASFLTGQYPHVHGVTNNHTSFALNSVTYATLLHAAGYTTGFVGKWHMGNQVERPGFDFSASFIGQGVYYNCPFVIDAGKQTVISTKWVDDTSADYAIDFLQKHRAQPFVLAVGFKSVHDPRKPNEVDKTLYDGDAPRPVPNLDVPAIYRAAFQLTGKAKSNLPDLDHYMECLAGADRDLGRLLDALDALGLSKNTMVIFTSDNGYNLGEHGLGDKRAAYEESMRTPFLIRAPFIPGTAGKVVDQMVLNVDVAPTLVDYAGLPIPKTMQGRSLRPLLEQETVTHWSRSFLYEYFFEKKFLTPTILAVRTDDSKLVTYPNHPDWTELFQLGTDPYEIDNMAGKPEAKQLQDALEAELNRLRDTTAYVVPGNSDEDDYVQLAEKRRDSQNKAVPNGAPATPAPAPSGSDFNYKIPPPPNEGGG